MNAAMMVDVLRDNVNEASEAHWSDELLLTRLNAGQRKVAKKVSMSRGNWLVTSEDVTPSASVITLPSDCSKPIYLEEKSSGRPVVWLDGGVSYRRVSRQVGTSIDTAGSREAYTLMSTIVVNQASFTTECTLWYQIRVPDLHQGTSAGGASTSLTFASDKNRIYLDDYYNGATLEMYDASGSYVALRSAISDYTAAGVATITGTGVASRTYGTIPRLPEETHDLIVLEATVNALMKVSSNIDPTMLDRFRTERNAEAKLVDEWLESRVVGISGVAIGEMY